MPPVKSEGVQWLTLNYSPFIRDDSAKGLISTKLSEDMWQGTSLPILARILVMSQLKFCHDFCKGLQWTSRSRSTWNMAALQPCSVHPTPAHISLRAAVLISCAMNIMSFVNILARFSAFTQTSFWNDLELWFLLLETGLLSCCIMWLEMNPA